MEGWWREGGREGGIDFPASVWRPGRSLIWPSPVGLPPLITPSSQRRLAFRGSCSSFVRRHFIDCDLRDKSRLQRAGPRRRGDLIKKIKGGKEKSGGAASDLILCVSSLQVSAAEAWVHLRCLFSASAGSEPPPPPSPPPLRSTSLSPSLLLDLALSLAVFGQQPAGRAAEVLRTVRDRCFST